MQSHPLNPSKNILHSSVSEKELLEAVEISGYPLQVVIGNWLREKDFHVIEEWGFLDKDTNDLRAIDIFAQKPLLDLEKIHQPRVRPTLNLLIECKSSSLPYVFFLSKNKPWLPNFPLIAGLFHNDKIVIKTNGDTSCWSVPIINAFGLGNHNFISQPDYCNFFSKCARKGKAIELSGTDPFFGLVLPLIKSMHYFRSFEEPPKTAMYFDCHLTLGVGVLDAPMIGVIVSENTKQLIYIPWIRVLRHESYQSGDWSARSKMFAVDIVHKNFLNDYLDKHVMQFASEFSKLSLKHQKILTSGKAFASGMQKDPWENIEPRLKNR
jgi:hypothetical protein